jgi:hypothetical protein
MKPIIRKLLIGFVILCVVLGGAYGARKAYRSVRQTRLLKQARTYLAKDEPRKAFLSVQGVLRANPKNVDACRLMADMLEQGRSPAALMWRNKVVEYNPKSTEDRLALVQTALVFRDRATATNALEGVDSAGKKHRRVPKPGRYNLSGRTPVRAGRETFP